jgi:fructose-bisphosphate aldolase class I
MNGKKLAEAARKMVVGDCGLWAMDESNPICNERFARPGIPQTGAARRGAASTLPRWNRHQTDSI